MAPLIVLVVATLVARLLGLAGLGNLRDWRAAIRVGLAVMFCFTAAAHFNAMRPDLVRMVPPQVPYPELMVTVTGICEVLGAIGLLVARTRRYAGIALIILLIAVLPANVYSAMTGGTLGGNPVTPLVPRIALQILFIALVWWSAVQRRHGD
jgi:uncharacterized membrane protein